MNKRHHPMGGANTGAPEDRGERSGSILNALTEEQFDLMAQLTAKVCGEFATHHGRQPTKGEASWVAQKIAMVILEPTARALRCSDGGRGSQIEEPAGGHR